MFSIICNVDFKDSDRSELKQTKQYRRLLQTSYVENLIDNSHFNESILIIERSLMLNEQSTSSSAGLLQYFNSILDASDSSSNSSFLDLIELAVSCLQTFAQANWLGPLPNEKQQQQQQQQNQQKSDENRNLNKIFYLTDLMSNQHQYDSLQEKIRANLSMDGENMFNIVKSSHLLLIAKTLLIDLVEKLERSFSLLRWWSLRLMFLYQQCFEERSATLTKLSFEYLDYVSAQLEQSVARDECDESVHKFARICFHLEAGHVYYQSYNWNSGQESFSKALEMAGIEYELTGVYGKKTRFQQKDLAQLLLKISKKQEGSVGNVDWRFSNSNLDPKLLPKDHALNDETLLERVKISNPNDELLLQSARELNQLEQLVIYCLLFDIQKNNPADELTFEEMSVFIQNLLMNPMNWCIQYATLFLRTKLEANSTKRIERSLLQLENLIDCQRMPDSKPTFSDRLQFFYGCGFPSYWQAQQQLANYYNKLGLINSSLDIYLNLEIWEEVIKCYQVLDKREKAEALIRKQLEMKETAELYCSLGDVTRDVQHYHKAIEFSKGKSAKAYRMLAKHQFYREQYVEAIENFEKSLAINSMQYDAWFMLGNAAFRSEKWDTSVRAFRSCTNLEPDNHQTWNNLAAAYIKLNQKDKAHTVFEEALKFDYENWKIWENFLWTSTDCGYFDDVIKAYHRLLDLKEKYVDLDVLKALRDSVQKNLKDANNNSIYKYKAKILKLFGRISSLVVNNWKIYWYYGDVVLYLSQVEEKEANVFTNVDLNNESADKMFSLYQKAFRNLYQQNGWELALETCDEMVTTSIELIEKCIEYGGFLNNPSDIFGSFNLSIRSIISKLKQKYQVETSSEEDGKFVKLLYLADLNPKFIQMQETYEKFIQKYFSS